MHLRVTIRHRNEQFAPSEYRDVLKIEPTSEPTAPYVSLVRSEHNDLLVNLDFYELVVNYYYALTPTSS